MLPNAETLAPLRRELEAFYESYDQRLEDNIRAEMEAFGQAHPETPAVLLKARLHEVTAEKCAPVVFRHDPFFFELGLRPGKSWGLAGVGTWLAERQQHLFDGGEENRLARAYTDIGVRAPGWWVGDNTHWWADYDHHSPGYTRVMDLGLAGIVAQATERATRTENRDERDFLEAVVRSNRAVIRIARGFAERAQEIAATETDGVVRARMQALAGAARQVPEHPPRTFFEGLSMMWFLREVTATLEGIGVSLIGHPDRLLHSLYVRDIAEGRLTRDEAADLIGRYLLPTDVKFGIGPEVASETSTTLTLGGCDRDGRPVYNDLTRLFLAVHRELALLNPKLNCRLSADSPEEYLEDLASAACSGHNVMAMYNDDAIIPANVKAGKSEEDCRLYGAGGCQETVIEGVEHSAGAYYYFNLAKVLEFSLLEDLPESCAWMPIASAVGAGSFGEVCDMYLDNFRRVIEQQTDWDRRRGKAWPQTNPCPFLSSTLDDCVDRATDYSAGGTRYSPAAICMSGFGTVVDSLAAVEKVVFEDRMVSLSELSRALAADFADDKVLRHALLRAPKFGRDLAAVDGLAGRTARELAQVVSNCRNSRGGRYQPSFFSYYAFASLGQVTGATADGRKAGDPLSQGFSPSRLGASTTIPQIFSSISSVDLTDYPANAILDLQMPLAQTADDPHTMAAVLRTFAMKGGATLQLNLVDADTLRAARERPEEHRDLVVRVCGYSAHFVGLSPSIQQEIIERLEV